MEVNMKLLYKKKKPEEKEKYFKMLGFINERNKKEIERCNLKKKSYQKGSENNV